MTRATSPHDLVTIGRVSIDLYPEQSSTPLRDVRSFRKMLGGSPTNVAFAAARLGLRTAVVTKVGDDGFGEAVRAAAERFGVDPSFIGTHPTLRTPLAFCEIHPPDHFPLLFYRAPTAPDLTLEVDELPAAALTAARAVWVTGTGLSREPSLSTTLAALRLRPPGALTVLDLDHRPELWEDVADAGPRARDALAHCTVAVGNQAEVATVVADADPESAARALLDLGVRLAVVKMGPEGVLAATADEVVHVPPQLVEVINGLGAGDAFGGALVQGLLAGLPLRRTVERANAAGALVAGRLGCADDMPEAEEIDRMVGKERA
jgi:5-dehydro-2-deoxygluconokinase